MCNWIKKHYLLLISVAAAGVLLWYWFPAFWTKNVSLAAQLTEQQLLNGIGRAAVILGILQFGLTTWVKLRIEESVKLEYSQKLEDYRREIKMRDQAARVAELMAYARWHWEDKDTSAVGEKLDSTAWELCLWLPVELCRALKNPLYDLTDDKIRDCLVSVRKALRGDKGDTLKAEDFPFMAKPPKVG